MDTKTRHEVVRFYRDEFKQQRRARPGRAPRPQLTPQEERDRNTVRWIRTSDRRRPKVNSHDTPEQQGASREARRSYDGAAGRRGGFDTGETLREMHATGRTRAMGPEARDAVTRRMNVRVMGGRVTTVRRHDGSPADTYINGQRQTSLGQRRSGASTFTPSERLGRTETDANATRRVAGVGELSRRRAISPGLAPPAPGSSGHAAYVRRFQEGNRRIRNARRRAALRRGDLVGAVSGR